MALNPNDVFGYLKTSYNKEYVAKCEAEIDAFLKKEFEKKSLGDANLLEFIFYKFGGKHVSPSKEDIEELRSRYYIQNWIVEIVAENDIQTGLRFMLNPLTPWVAGHFAHIASRGTPNV